MGRNCHTERNSASRQKNTKHFVRPPQCSSPAHRPSRAAGCAGCPLLALPSRSPLGQGHGVFSQCLLAQGVRRQSYVQEQPTHRQPPGTASAGLAAAGRLGQCCPSPQLSLSPALLRQGPFSCLYATESHFETQHSHINPGLC